MPYYTKAFFFINIFIIKSTAYVRKSEWIDASQCIPILNRPNQKSIEGFPGVAVLPQSAVNLAEGGLLGKCGILKNIYCHFSQ